LPFSEDVRQFTFGSLPLTEETTASNKKFQPTDEQLRAMDSLIDNMDLTKGAGDDDDDEELLKPKLTFNPYLQRLYQCLQHRASFPDDPLPELSPVIANYLKPSQAVMTKCEPVIEKMTKLYKLERVVKKKEGQTGDAMFQDNDVDGAPPAKKIKADDDLGGGMAGLSKARVTEVGTVAPVDDFRSMIANRDEDKFELACSQMQKRIIQIVTDSFGSQFYSKAMDCLKALRDECIKNVEPKQFNDYLRVLKDKLSEKGRKDFWSDISKEKISLITKLECEESHVTKEEAANFISEDVKVKDEEPSAEPEEDADDLLAMME
jgi:ATP-dependent DNA helicase 2 subunit 2